MLGSIEAAAFTGDQLAMLSEFVDKRGGGLLMLGGPRSFSEGGYAGTALGETLPVTLERMTPPAEPVVTRLAVRPDAGRRRPRRVADRRHRPGLGGALGRAAASSPR